MAIKEYAQATAVEPTGIGSCTAVENRCLGSELLLLHFRVLGSDMMVCLQSSGIRGGSRGGEYGAYPPPPPPR